MKILIGTLMKRSNDGKTYTDEGGKFAPGKTLRLSQMGRSHEDA